MDCPRILPLRTLGRKWSYLVLHALQHESTFSGVKRELKGITNRVLSRELGMLQQEALVAHEGTYRLTNAGNALIDAIEPLVNWSVQHRGLAYCPKSKRCSRCVNYMHIVGKED